jgi:hypothetical protein
MEKDSDLQAGRDRNLLFGVIAVRLAFVTPEDLAEVSRDWSENPSSDLGELLVSRGCISEETRALITPIVEAELNEHDGDAGATLESFGGEAAVHESFAASLVLADNGVSSVPGP